ncbi:hypothetical protein Ddc_05011 [Ditylenchus destructor]|nr:hypothetical protein Ddc_05011 [Ditylenchus destructor]
MDKTTRLQQITSNIRNTAPACANSQNSNLYIMIALIEKLGTNPFEAVSIEKFTNLLRSKYQNYQDVSLCDTLVLIVNSRMDRQVFTVAGRDAKLSREVLQMAFHRNVGHFRGGNYALGLEGMIEYIVSSYNSAHIVQVQSPVQGVDSVNSVQLPASALPTSGSGQFITHGVRQKPDPKVQLEKFNFDAVPEEDRLWVQILYKASSQCGYDAERISRYTRAIVEEAMQLSLKLISDSRYNKIEEESQDVNGGPNPRDKAWQNAKTSFLDSLYEKYGQKFPRKLEKCPDIAENNASRRLL